MMRLTIDNSICKIEGLSVKQHKELTDTTVISGSTLKLPIFQEPITVSVEFTWKTRGISHRFLVIFVKVYSQVLMNTIG